MKLDQLIAQHVGGTTLDSTRVKRFMTTPPHYYQWGISQHLDPVSLGQLAATDLVEFYLGLYLTGRHKTLQAVAREVRAFAGQDANSAAYLIGFSLAGMGRRLLAMEWYELLGRLEMAKQTIVPLLAEWDDPARPAWVSLLVQSY